MGCLPAWVLRDPSQSSPPKSGRVAPGKACGRLQVVRRMQPRLKRVSRRDPFDLHIAVRDCALAPAAFRIEPGFAGQAVLFRSLAHHAGLGQDRSIGGHTLDAAGGRILPRPGELPDSGRWAVSTVEGAALRGSGAACIQFIPRSRFSPNCAVDPRPNRESPRCDKPAIEAEGR